MLKSRFFLLPDVSRHRAGVLTILILLTGLMPVTDVSAFEIGSLYTAEVPLDQEADDPRGSAYRAALREVLLRVSGSELGNDPARIELLFPEPAAYVIQFRPGVNDTLWVSFDGQAIESVLRASGQTVWGSNRPLTLIWLAVDWGQGRREIVAADGLPGDDAGARSIDRNRLLRQRIVEIAERRGLPVAFPLLDTEDLRKVSFSDIWGGFDEALLDASRRYEANSILVGRIRPRSSQRNRWNYYFGGEERNFSGEPEEVLSRVADLLAAEFAISGDARLASVYLTVDGIDSVEAYADLQNLLAGLSIVEQLRIDTVRASQVRYHVEVLGGEERLRRALRFNGLLPQENFSSDDLDEGTAPTGLMFYYDPD